MRKVWKFIVTIREEVPDIITIGLSFDCFVDQCAHKSVLHNGVREIVSEIINRCDTRKKFEGYPYIYPESPALPDCRVVPRHCFSNIGIDYPGQVFIKNGSQSKLNGEMHKVWIVLITCCTSRAFYLDIASSLDGLVCIKVLQRFSSRYVQPVDFLKDL